MDLPPCSCSRQPDLDRISRDAPTAKPLVVILTWTTDTHGHKLCSNDRSTGTMTLPEIEPMSCWEFQSLMNQTISPSGIHPRTQRPRSFKCWPKGAWALRARIPGMASYRKSLLTSHSVMKMCCYCFMNTKYKCLRCELPTCNNCSVFELNNR